MRKPIEPKNTNSHGKKQVRRRVFEVQEATWKDAKLFAVMNDRSIKSVVEDAIRKYVKSGRSAA